MRPELEAEQWLVPALKTVAMGDTAAVGMAQCAHLGVLLSTGRVSLDSFLCLEGRPPRRGPICGLMIDDFVCLDRVSRLCPRPMGPSILEGVREAYSQVRLPRHEKKAVEGETSAEFWGCCFDGAEGRVRPSYKRAVPLAFLLLRLVTVGCATSDLLDSLVGGVVSCFQYRRRCLCLLQHVYAEPRPRSRSEPFALSSLVIGELLAAVPLLCQCDIDLRAKAAPLVLATDASDVAEAGAYCSVSVGASEELYRHTLSKGLWNKLLSPCRAYLREHAALDPDEELPGADEGYVSHPLWDELATTQSFLPWGRITRVRHRRHINIGEMRAAIAAEERLARDFADVRYVHLQDSQVSLAAMTKGRSSSSSLNLELQRSLGTYLGSGLRPGFGYLRTSLNPADDRTRDTTLRSASRVPPAWFAKFLEGDLEALQEFLHGVGLADAHIRGLPDPAEITQSPAFVGVSSPEPGIHSSSRGNFESAGAVGCKAVEGRSRKPRRALLRPSSPLPPSSQRLLATLDFGFFRHHLSCRDLLQAFGLGPGWLVLGWDSSGLEGALLSKGLVPWCLSLPLAGDLFERGLDGAVEELLLRGCFVGLYISPPSSTFSTAVRPPVRNKEHPRGLPGLSDSQLERLAHGNRVLDWVQRLGRLAATRSLNMIIDHPQNSLFWKQKGWDELSCGAGWEDTLVDLCCFGAGARKATRLRARGFAGGQVFRCSCPAGHLQLRGRNPANGASWTRESRGRPKRFWKWIAGSIRYGEADNPGPRRRTTRPPRQLAEVELVEPATAALRARYYDTFAKRVEAGAGEGSFVYALLAPQLLVRLLVGFAQHLYDAGTPLHYYRQLVAHVTCKEKFRAADPGFALLGNTFQDGSCWNLCSIALPFQNPSSTLCARWRFFGDGADGQRSP